MSLAAERGWEGSTRSLNAIGEGSGEYAPGFFCNKRKMLDLGFYVHMHLSFHVAVVAPGVREDPAVLRFKKLLLDEVLLV